MTLEPQRTSDVLDEFLRSNDKPRIAVGDILSALGNRAYALLFVVLGLPNCLPVPPPLPLICGLLLLLVAIQMTLGWRIPWAPRRVRALSTKRSVVEAIVEKARPWLRSLERYARPRFLAEGSWLNTRAIGVLTVAFSIGLLFSAPFIGQLPFGLAFCIIGIGLVERDGVIVAIGGVFGLIGMAISAGFVIAVITGLMRLIHLA
jgi:hypothetical protein